MPKGNIHGIWLTTNGNLHPSVIPTLQSWHNEAAPNGFQVNLWTNTKDVNPESLAELKDCGIKVQDHIACKDSSLFSHYLTFFLKGKGGDKTALALASDVLRMAILDLAAENEFFIYADPNDTEFKELASSLKGLTTQPNQSVLFFQLNYFGYAFRVRPSRLGNTDSFMIDNDVLLACKKVDPLFFKHYLNAYKAHLDKTVALYRQPETNLQAKELVMQITHQTSERFFEIVGGTDKSHIQPTFDDDAGTISVLDFGIQRCLPYARITSQGNTWLPTENHAEISLVDTTQRLGFTP